jgi:hypothetical protein
MKRPNITSSQLEAIAEMRGEQGLSYNSIAQTLGLSVGAVSWWCLVSAIEKPGIPPRPVSRGPMEVVRGGFVVRRFTADEDAVLLSMEASGANYGAISKGMKRNRSSIVGRLATLARRDERLLAASDASMPIIALTLPLMPG